MWANNSGPGEMFLRMPATWQVERGESRRATPRFVAGEAQAGSPFLCGAPPKFQLPTVCAPPALRFYHRPCHLRLCIAFPLLWSRPSPPAAAEFQQCLQTPARFVLSTLLPFLDRCCCIGAHSSTSEPVHLYCGPGVLVHSRSRALYFVQKSGGTRRQDLFVVGVLEEIWKHNLSSEIQR